MAGISALGLGSGLDLSGILDSLRSVDEAPIRLMQTRQQQSDQRVFELDALNTKFLAVKTAAEELASLDTYNALISSSSDESVLTVSTTSSANAGTYSMTVGRLATQDSWVSTGVATADTVVSTAGGVFSYDFNGAAGGSVVMAAGATMQELADAINADGANPGVTAMVMDTGDGSGTPFVLQLVSNETGEANSITAVDFSNLDTVTLGETEPAVNRDAELIIGGVTYNRGTNTITDLFAGMTLNLETTGSSTVKVESDSATIKEKILALVEAFNSAMVEISSNSEYDADTQVAGPLNGMSSIQSLPNQLSSILTSTLALGGTYENLIDIGLEVDKYGIYSFDETVLDDALSTNLADVQLLFAGDDLGTEGVADLFSNQLDEITKSSALGGLIGTEKDAAQGNSDRLGDQITEATERLDMRYETLKRQFIMLDQLMSSLRSEGDFLASTFAGMNDMWGGTS
ncbi:MAG: flagellar filament capping protein FliD [Desulfobulbaceae bacterium]|nr:flagellar filament capping protein FliD [Desulfobulbaceae bacterium]